MHWFSSIVANAKTQELASLLPLPLETESFLHVILEYMFACIARSLLSLLLFALVSLCYTAFKMVNARGARSSRRLGRPTIAHTVQTLGTRTVRCRGWACVVYLTCAPRRSLRLRLECRTHRVLASFGTHRIDVYMALHTPHASHMCCACRPCACGDGIPAPHSSQGEVLEDVQGERDEKAYQRDRVWPPAGAAALAVLERAALAFVRIPSVGVWKGDRAGRRRRYVQAALGHCAA